MGGLKFSSSGSTLSRPSESSRSQSTIPGHWNLSVTLKISGISVKQSPISSGAAMTRGIIAEGRAQHLPKVALLGLSGYPGGWPGALAVDDNDGNLRHRGEAEPFGHQCKAAAGGCTHGTDTGMGRPDGVVHHANLVLNLAHHNAGLAPVRGHPVQHAGGGAHGISSVKLHAGSCSAHRQRGVAAEHRIALLSHRQRFGEGLEVRRGVFVTGACDADVLIDHRLALLAELRLEHTLQRLEAHAHHAQSCSQRQRILGNLVARDVRERAHRQRAYLHAVRSRAGLDGVRVIDTSAAGLEQAQMAIHGVLIQRNQQIDPVAQLLHLVHAGANGKEGVAAADDRLVCVVGVHVQPTPAEDQCEDVARCSDTLTGRAADAEGKGVTHGFLPTQTACTAFDDAGPA